MRLIRFLKKFFRRTEVPLTPEEEIALREQMRIMQDLDRHGQHGPGTPRTLPRGWDGVGGSNAAKNQIWFGPKGT